MRLVIRVVWIMWTNSWEPVYRVIINIIIRCRMRNVHSQLAPLVGSLSPLSLSLKSTHSSFPSCAWLLPLFSIAIVHTHTMKESR